MTCKCSWQACWNRDSRCFSGDLRCWRRSLCQESEQRFAKERDSAVRGATGACPATAPRSSFRTAIQRVSYEAVGTERLWRARSVAFQRFPLRRVPAAVETQSSGPSPIAPLLTINVLYTDDMRCSQAYVSEHEDRESMSPHSSSSA